MAKFCKKVITLYITTKGQIFIHYMAFSLLHTYPNKIQVGACDFNGVIANCDRIFVFSKRCIICWETVQKCWSAHTCNTRHTAAIHRCTTQRSL